VSAFAYLRSCHHLIVVKIPNALQIVIHMEFVGLAEDRAVIIDGAANHDERKYAQW